MKKLSETYKELGIAFSFPIEIKDENGNEIYHEDSDGYRERHEYDSNGKATYYENSDDLWERYEYDSNGNQTYLENNDGYWSRREYDSNGNQTYWEGSDGYKEGTPRSACVSKEPKKRTGDQILTWLEDNGVDMEFDYDINMSTESLVLSGKHGQTLVTYPYGKGCVREACEFVMDQEERDNK
jgi:uncharacterized protein RhaS with RHS repeats